MNTNRFLSILSSFKVSNPIMDALTGRMSLPLIPVVGTEKGPGFMASCSGCTGSCVGDCEGGCQGDCQGNCYGCSGYCDGLNR